MGSKMDRESQVLAYSQFERSFGNLSETFAHNWPNTMTADNQIKHEIDPDSPASKCVDLAVLASKAELELVDNVREMLRAELGSANDSNQLEDEQKYSREHYAHILEPKSPHTCLRYLRHRNLNVGETVALMKEALEWRRKHFDPIKVEELAKELWLGAPFSFCGHTRDGTCDLLYCVGKNYRKADNCVRYLFRTFTTHAIFGWDTKNRNTMRKFYIVFDVTNTGIRNIDMDFAQWVVSIRDYVPARIEAIYVIGIPFVMQPFIRLIISWLPEQFKRLVHCGSREEYLEPLFDENNLPCDVTGKQRADKEMYRCAPPQTPWLDDCPHLSDKIRQAIEDSTGFCVDAEKRAYLRDLQMYYESLFKKG